MKSLKWALAAFVVIFGIFAFVSCDDGSADPTPQTVATPTASVPAGNYTMAQTVALFCATDGADIYYTLNGSTPGVNSTPYSGPISITQTSTLKAIAIKDGMNNSGVLTATYTIVYSQTAATPTASLAGGNYATAQTVVLSCATDGADIYYTLNGSTPSASSTLYTAPITISVTTTLKAIAIKSGMNNSDLLSVTYTIGNPQLQTVATPTASPNGGTHTLSVTVTLSCETDGADIYYTLNGNTPGAGSSLYTVPIIINTTTTLKAIAIKGGMNDSGLLTATYTISDALYENPAYSSGGFTASVYVPATGTATIDINGYDFADRVSIKGYESTLPDARYFSIVTRYGETGFDTFIKDRDVIVTINGAPGVEFVSLTDVHHFYQAIYGNRNPSNKPNPAPIQTQLTPSFSGEDWVGGLSWLPNQVDNLYDKYASDTEIMSGITVKFLTIGDDNKYVIEYDGPLNIEDLRYNHDLSNPTSYDNRCYGFGIIPVTSLTSPLLEHRDWDGVIGSYNSNLTGDYREYFKHLGEIGLIGLSYGGVDSSVTIVDWAAPIQHNMFFELPSSFNASNRSNIVADGLLSFIKCYYDSGRMSCLDGVYYPGGKIAFDGLPVITAENPRIDADGKHNPAFTANITTEFAKYIMTKLGLKTFANTNIIGDGKLLLTDSALPAKVKLDLRNVNLVGDHNTGSIPSEGLWYIGVFTGVVRVEDISPRILENTNTNRGGYLIIDDVNENDGRGMAFHRFKVVDIRVNASKAWYVGGESVIDPPNPSTDTIIYNQKYATVGSLIPYPYYRAVRNSSGTPLLTGTTAQGFAAKYASTDTSKPVPPLDPTAWINAANQATPADPAYRTWANVPAAEKWTAADFGALAEVP